MCFLEDASGFVSVDEQSCVPDHATEDDQSWTINDIDLKLDFLIVFLSLCILYKVVDSLLYPKVPPSNGKKNGRRKNKKLLVK